MSILVFIHAFIHFPHFISEKAANIILQYANQRTHARNLNVCINTFSRFLTTTFHIPIFSHASHTPKIVFVVAVN